MKHICIRTPKEILLLSIIAIPVFCMYISLIQLKSIDSSRIRQRIKPQIGVKAVKIYAE